MAIRDGLFRLVAVGVLALHLVAGWLPETSAWGVWHFTVLPRPLAWLLVVAAAVLALTPVNDALRQWGRRLWDILPGRSHHHRWYGAVALASAVPFWLLRIQHMRWGDAEFIVKALAYTGADRPIWTIYNWQSPLTIFIHARLWLLLNPAPGITVESLYGVTSVLSGVGFVYVLLCLADELGRDRLEKAIIIGIVATTGSMQLFFGYIENYTIMSLGALLTLYLGVRCLRGKTAPVWPALALAVTNAFHPSTIVLWPAVLYLAWRAARTAADNGPHKMVWAQVALPPLLVFAALAAFMTASGHGPAALLVDDRPGGADGIPFVPLFQVTSQWQHYTMFSAAHLLDWANEHLLISSFGLLLLADALIAGIGERLRGTRPATGDGGITAFLLIASLAYLLLTFVWNPDYGGRKDWDLFAPSAFVYTTLAAYLWVRGQTSEVLVGRRLALARTSTLLIAVAALHTVTWVYYNTLPWQ